MAYCARAPGTVAGRGDRAMAGHSRSKSTAASLARHKRGHDGEGFKLQNKAIRRKHNEFSEAG
jgi:hypothetical protein